MEQGDPGTVDDKFENGDAEPVDVGDNVGAWPPEQRLNRARKWKADIVMNMGVVRHSGSRGSAEESATGSNAEARLDEAAGRRRRRQLASRLDLDSERKTSRSVRKGKSKKWAKTAQLDLLDDFEVWLKRDEVEKGIKWRKFKEVLTKGGVVKRILVCNHRNCKADLMVDILPDHAGVSVSRGTSKHVHKPATRLLTPEIREAVDALCNAGMEGNPALVHGKLLERGLHAKLASVENYLNRRRQARTEVDAKDELQAQTEAHNVTDERPPPDTTAPEAPKRYSTRMADRESMGLVVRKFSWKRKLKGRREWITAGTFDTESGFDEWLSKDQTPDGKALWRKGNEYVSIAGTVKIFVCNFKGCPAQLKTILYCSDQSLTAFNNARDHLHKCKVEGGLSNEAKEAIQNLVNGGVSKVSHLLNYLQCQGFEVDRKNQILHCFKQARRTYLRVGRKTAAAAAPSADERRPVPTSPLPPSATRTSSTAKDSSRVKGPLPLSVYCEVQEWCNLKRSQTNPVIEPNVIGGVGGGDKPHLIMDAFDPASGKLCVAMSTANLLNIAAAARVVHVAITYKLLWQRLPSILVCVSDGSKKVHPVVYAVCSGDDVSDIESVLRATKAAVEGTRRSQQQQQHQEGFFAFSPEVVLALPAGSKEIPEAARRVFGPGVATRCCWQDVKKNIEFMLRKAGKDARKLFLQDVSLLQLAMNERQFSQAASCLLNKWRTIVGKTDGPDNRVPDDFPESFLRSWLEGTNSSWFEGYHAGSPAVSKALELFNPMIDRHVFRERLPADQFLGLCSEMTQAWSEDLASQTRPFYDRPQVTPKLLGEAWAYIQEAKTPSVLDDKVTWFLPAAGKSSLTEDDVTVYLNTMEMPDDFDSYAKQRLSVWVVKVVEGETEGESTTTTTTATSSGCTCPAGMREGVCKHIVAVSAWTGLISIPDETKEAFEVKRKRGRPPRYEHMLVLNHINNYAARAADEAAGRGHVSLALDTGEIQVVEGGDVIQVVDSDGHGTVLQVVSGGGVGDNSSNSSLNGIIMTS